MSSLRQRLSRFGLPAPIAPPIWDYLRGPRARHANDASAAASVNWRHAPRDLPPGLELQWFGTAGFRLGYEGTQLWIEPYLSRAGAGAVLRRQTLAPDPTNVDRFVQRADAVLMGHTHFDHAIDTPLVARRHGCPVYGSDSLAHLLHLYGLGDQAVVVEPYREYPIGPFVVTFVPSVHSKLILGLKVPMDGELTCNHLDDLNAGGYRAGQVFGIHIAVAGVTFYHQGSADLIDDAIRHTNVDYFLAGIAGRGFTPRYWERILPRLQPRIIVPQHHDNFFRPLGTEMGFSFNVNFGAFLDEIGAVSRDFEIRALEPLQTVGG